MSERRLQLNAIRKHLKWKDHLSETTRMKNLTIGRLFGAAAGRCSICRTVLFEDEVKIGQMAHIIAKSKNGPRGDSISGGSNEYENLILLCANDHLMVDHDAANWTEERLRITKEHHETWVRSSLKEFSFRGRDIESIQKLMHFLPFSSLKYQFQRLPVYFSYAFFDALDAMHAFPIDQPQCRPFGDSKLEMLYVNFERFIEVLVGLAHSDDDPDYTYISPEYEAEFLIINKQISYQKLAMLKARMAEVARLAEESYDALLQYLRSAYPEVDLSGYRRL